MRVYQLLRRSECFGEVPQGALIELVELEERGFELQG